MRPAPVAARLQHALQRLVVILMAVTAAVSFCALDCETKVNNPQANTTAATAAATIVAAYDLASNRRIASDALSYYAQEIVAIGCDLQLPRDMLWGEAVTDFSELEEKGKLMRGSIRETASTILDNALLIGAVAALAHSAWRREHPLKAALLIAQSVLAHFAWARKRPRPCPYRQRFWVQIPHLGITRVRLRKILAPQPGERILEVGPGTGYYSLHVAQWLEPDGVLDILDAQQPMLEHTMRRANKLGITNIVPAQGDACALPYSDNRFDAAYINVTLGEIPDQIAALRELRRVLRPDGRLVVGEIIVDPHMVTFTSLRTRMESVGLRCICRLGGRLAYFASFRVPQ